MHSMVRRRFIWNSFRAAPALTRGIHIEYRGDYLVPVGVKALPVHVLRSHENTSGCLFNSDSKAILNCNNQVHRATDLI